jgi:hypothetical protein
MIYALHMMAEGKRSLVLKPWQVDISRRSNLGNPHSLETRKKMSAKAVGNKYSLGFIHTPETRAKIVATNKGNRRSAGHVQTEEHKAKIGAANLGKKHGPHSDEHKAKISAASLGRKHSEEAKRKMSEACKLRSPPTEETRRKMSESAISRPPRSAENIAALKAATKLYSNTPEGKEAKRRASLIRWAKVREIHQQEQLLPVLDPKILEASRRLG